MASQQPHESATTAFTSSTQKGYAPLRVEFLDTSTGEVIDRYWDFGDGTLVNSDRTPAHTYIIPGKLQHSFHHKAHGHGIHHRQKAVYHRYGRLHVQ